MSYDIGTSTSYKIEQEKNRRRTITNLILWVALAILMYFMTKLLFDYLATL